MPLIPQYHYSSMRIVDFFCLGYTEAHKLIDDSIYKVDMYKFDRNYL